MNDCSASLNNYTSNPPIIRGKCLTGKCQCSKGFTGNDCSKMSELPSDLPIAIQPFEDDCTQEVCTATCTFGGSCTSTDTCTCFDHWGHGPPPDPSTIKAPKPPKSSTSSASSTSSTSSPTSPTEPSLIDRWPMISTDRQHLQSVLITLGYSQSIPKGKNDPCLKSWIVSNHVSILCNNHGSVTEIDFSRTHLSGTISEDITKLRSLRVLSLNNNNIKGIIPRSIGNLNKLEYLMLYKNQLKGNLPNSLVQCNRLITIVLYGNHLTGGLPSQIGRLQNNLRYLDLSFNQLSGDLPATLGDLINLDTMYINHNNLIGIIPDTIINLPKLKLFRYEENHLKNTIENIGNVDVYSEPNHVHLADEYYHEWKNGLDFDTREEKNYREEKMKKIEYRDQLKKNKEGEDSNIHSKSLALLPPGFRPDDDDKGGPPSLGTQIGGASILDGT
jgi:hypothetical protein